MGSINGVDCFWVGIATNELVSTTDNVFFCDGITFRVAVTGTFDF